MRKKAMTVRVTKEAAVLGRVVKEGLTPTVSRPAASPQPDNEKPLKAKKVVGCWFPLPGL